MNKEHFLNKNLKNNKVGIKKINQADLENILNQSEKNNSFLDLSFHDLSNLNFDGFNLRNANLSYCDLTNADLSYCDLRNANLSFSDLSRVNLNYCDLNNANLDYILGTHYNLIQLKSQNFFILIFDDYILYDDVKMSFEEYLSSSESEKYHKNEYNLNKILIKQLIDLYRK